MTRTGRNRSTEDRGQITLDHVADVLRENQKLITLGHLTASIAHEINNPLESITNLLYLMEQDESGDISEYLKLAQRELSRVVQISKQTLTFSRETTAPVRVQITELIEEVLGLYARRIRDKSLHVARQYEAYEPVMVFPGEMRQVFSNLIANAIEASEERGRIVIRIRPARRWAGSAVRGVRLSIGDNGSGMPEDVRTRLGEPFFTTKGQSGTGLGLWVTRSILGRYGGRIQVRSSVEPERHGTVFSLFLPLHLRPVAVMPGDTEGSGPVIAGGGRGLRWRGLQVVPQGNKEPAQERNRERDEESSAKAAPQMMRLRVNG